jgi:hypothetical protein
MDSSLAIEGRGHYCIEGSALVYSDGKTHRVTTILGDPRITSFKLAIRGLQGCLAGCYRVRPPRESALHQYAIGLGQISLVTGPRFFNG